MGNSNALKLRRFAFTFATLIFILRSCCGFKKVFELWSMHCPYKGEIAQCRSKFALSVLNLENYDSTEVVVGTIVAILAANILSEGKHDSIGAQALQNPFSFVFFRQNFQHTLPCNCRR